MFSLFPVLNGNNVRMAITIRNAANTLITLAFLLLSKTNLPEFSEFINLHVNCEKNWSQ